MVCTDSFISGCCRVQQKYGGSDAGVHRILLSDNRRIYVRDRFRLGIVCHHHVPQAGRTGASRQRAVQGLHCDAAVAKRKLTEGISSLPHYARGVSLHPRHFRCHSRDKDERRGRDRKERIGHIDIHHDNQLSPRTGRRPFSFT